jgi:hypothetical protein
VPVKPHPHALRLDSLRSLAAAASAPTELPVLRMNEHTIEQRRRRAAHIGDDGMT